MPNGRCRMHGGPSPGAPKGNRNAFKHGRYTIEAITNPLMRTVLCGLAEFERSLMMARTQGGIERAMERRGVRAAYQAEPEAAALDCTALCGGRDGRIALPASSR
jgi:hypothetical protein